MIIGNIKNIAQCGLSEPLQQILNQDGFRFEQLKQHDDGKLQLENQLWFCNLGWSKTQPQEQRQTEWHKEYLDIQLMIDGEEHIYCCSHDASDFESHEKKPDLYIVEQCELNHKVLLKPGDFVVYMPGEPHQALCSVYKDMNVRKAVFKIPKVCL